MPAPETSAALLELLRKSGLVDGARLDPYLNGQSSLPEEPKPAAITLVSDGLLTNFQAKQLLLGRYRGFHVGKYKILEQLGQGGMGAVYLCEHLLMRRRVAIKVLPQEKANDPASLERFYREARAVAALDHPNIVRAHDIDQEGHLHFLVMEYVDGNNLHDIVRKHGPMDLLRSSHYIRQAAVGLQHLDEAGLVHRDIKPGNLLLDRQGTIKILDMGLARSFREGGDSVTKQFDEKSVLGTADYLAPEQAMCSSEVDIRADIYSLGATWYYLLSGHAPFEEGTITQKLLWHQMRQPKPLLSYRADLPPEILAVVEKMMSKEAKERYQKPAEVVQALDAFTQTPIPLPPEEEMPRLCQAARGSSAGEGSQVSLPAALTASGIGFPKAVSKAGRSSSGAIVSASVVEAMDYAASGSGDRGAGGYDSSGSHENNAQYAPTKPVPRSGRLNASPDTDNPIAHADTRPSGTKVASGRRKKKPQGTLAQLRKHQRWIYIGAAAFVALVGGLWFVVSSLLNLGRTEPMHSGEKNVPPVITLVKKSGEKVTFKTLNEAINVADSGETIQVGSSNGKLQPTLEDRLIASGGTVESPDHIITHRKNITIEADPDLGGPVKWRPRRNLDADVTLIVLTNFEDLRIKNFVIDGLNQLNDLIQVNAACPGLRLEYVQLMGFNNAGIRFLGAAGTKENPITLRNVTFVGNSESYTASGIVFGANAAQQEMTMDRMPQGQTQNQQNRGPTLSHDIRVEECTFRESMQSAVDVREAVVDVHFFQNRFYRLNGAFSFHKSVPARRISMQVESNTFCETKGAFQFEVMPTADSENQIMLRNNLFAKVEKVVVSNGRSMEPAGVKSKWIWFNDAGNPAVSAPAGDRYFRRTFDAAGTPKQAILDIICDDGFKVWLNDTVVGQGDIVNGGKVQAFPVTAMIRPGKNVLAVQGTNKTGPAGLLVRLHMLDAKGAFSTIISDENWRVSNQAVDNWQTVAFKDDTWSRARPLADYGAGNDKWRKLVWESVEQDKWSKLTPSFIKANTEYGNVRDQATNVGAVPLDITERPVAIDTDPHNPGKFLRYSRDNGLSQAGESRKPVGYPPY
jgi:serine/threonine protein kinase